MRILYVPTIFQIFPGPPYMLMLSKEGSALHFTLTPQIVILSP